MQIRTLTPSKDRAPRPHLYLSFISSVSSPPNPPSLPIHKIIVPHVAQLRKFRVLRILRTFQVIFKATRHLRNALQMLVLDEDLLARPLRMSDPAEIPLIPRLKIYIGLIKEQNRAPEFFKPKEFGKRLLNDCLFSSNVIWSNGKKRALGVFRDTLYISSAVSCQRTV